MSPAIIRAHKKHMPVKEAAIRSRPPPVRLPAAAAQYSCFALCF